MEINFIIINVSALYSGHLSREGSLSVGFLSIALVFKTQRFGNLFYFLHTVEIRTLLGSWMEIISNPNPGLCESNALQ
jgi:hypothetical protein